MKFSFCCKVSMVAVTGWQWDPVDRPTFREIHIALDTMIHTSSVGEGILITCYLNSLFVLFTSGYGSLLLCSCTENINLCFCLPKHSVVSRSVV